MTTLEDQPVIAANAEKLASSMMINNNMHISFNGEKESAKEILALQSIDDAMAKKMHLVNNVSWHAQ